MTTNRPKRKERGVALIAAICFTVVVLGLGLGVTSMASQEQVSTKRAADIIVARNLAEAGADMAMWQLKQNPAWRAGLANQSLTTTVAGQAVTLGQYTVPAIGAANADGSIKIASSGLGTGLTNGTTGKTMTVAMVIYPLAGPAMFTGAAFGDTGVNIESGTTDSYDSNSAYGGSNVGYAGTIATNSSIPTCMTAKTNGQKGQVNGKVVYGRGTNIAAATYPKAQVNDGTGNSTTAIVAATEMKPLPPVVIPAGTPSLGAVSGGTITGGTNTAVAFQCTGISGFPTINGKVVLYCTGNISLSGNGVLKSSTGKPADLIIYCTSTCTSVSLGGNCQEVACIYAPSAAIASNGGGNSGAFWGSMIGKSVNIQQHYDFHYDQQLGSVAGFTSAGFAVKTWQENG